MIPWLAEHILTIFIFSPLLWLAIIALLPKKYEAASFEISIIGAGAGVFISLIMLVLFGFGSRYLFVENLEGSILIGSLFSAGLDGLSVLLIVITAIAYLILVPLIKGIISRNKKYSYVALLLILIGMYGLFASVDILQAYIFMEISVISFGSLVFLLKGQKSDLSKYILLNAASGILILTAIVLFIISAGSGSFEVLEAVPVSADIQIAMISLLMPAMFCRMGLFPLNMWAEEVSKEENNFEIIALLSFIFTGGAYFFYRMVPSVAVVLTVYRPLLSWLVVASMLISSIMAVSRKNLIFFYLSAFQVSFALVLLGMVSSTKQGFAGSAMLMATIYISMVMLPLVYKFKWRLVVLIFAMAMSFVPGLLNFPGVFMVWMGLFNSSWPLAVASLCSVIILSGAMFTMAGRFLCNKDAVEEKILRFKLPEIVYTFPVIVVVFAVGIFPDILLKYVKHSAEALWLIFSKQI